MITRFFRTSKPQHYFIFLVILVGVYAFQRTRSQAISAGPLNFAAEGLSALALLGTFFLLIFIVTKNNLTQNNSFAAAYFCLYSMLIPEVFSNPYILGSNLLVLMAFRRVFSINTGVNLKKKYYDSALWLCLAALFYPLTIFYFIPLLISVLLLQTARIKHLLVIGFGVATIVIFCLISSFFFGTNLPWENDINTFIGFDFLVYNDPFIFGSMALFLTISIWSLATIFNQQFFKFKTRYLSTTLVVMHLTGMAIPLLSMHKSVAECLFVLFPLAVITANISERNHSKWMSELIMIIVLLLIAIRLIFDKADFGLVY